MFKAKTYLNMSVSYTQQLKFFPHGDFSHTKHEESIKLPILVTDFN